MTFVGAPSMDVVAIVGGSGFYCLEGLEDSSVVHVQSPYQPSPVKVHVGRLGLRPVLFLPRHGALHTVPPHKINYRANIDALAQLGAQHVIGINAVGGMTSLMSPGSAVLADQIIDYTWGREHTFFDEFNDELAHIDFSAPLDSPYRKGAFTHLAAKMNTLNSACYACVQGPRLESAAEVKKMQRDGCDIVGMTMMPEAALAREKRMSYMSICVVCNWAAGISSSELNAVGEQQQSFAPLCVESMKAVLAESLTKVQDAIVETLTLV